MSDYRFQVLGPFSVPIDGTGEQRRIDCRPARKSVFDEAAANANTDYDLKDAIGLYVFGLKTGPNKSWPYYVGKACEQTLWVRSFQLSDKPKVYSSIVQQYARATAFIYLLPLLTPSRKLARLGTNGSRIETAEEQLIGMALQANIDLWNVKHRSALDSFKIDGVHSLPGKPSNAALNFRKLLDFDVD